MSSISDRQLIVSLNKITKDDDEKVQIILTYLNNKYPNPRTKGNKTSIMKKLAMKYQVLDNSSNYIKITNKELYKQIIDENVKKGIPDTIEIPKYKINVILAMKYLKNDPYNLLPYLLFVTGRRICEMFIPDNFFIEEDGRLYIKMVVKKRNGISEAGYPISLIDVTPKQFLELYNDFLKMITKKNGSQMKKDTIRKTSAVILKYDLDNDDLKIKDLRALHVAYHLKFNPLYKNKNSCESVRDILSHEGMGAIKHYLSRFRIV